MTTIWWLGLSCSCRVILCSVFDIPKDGKNESKKWKSSPSFTQPNRPKKCLCIRLILIDNVCLQHPYVYGVLVFEAMATFIGQVSVLSLIALFGAATTAMVNALENDKRLTIQLWCMLKNWMLPPYCSSPVVGDDRKKSRHPVVVVHDIHEATDWTTRDWTSAHRNGDRAKDGARDQAAFTKEECGGLQRGRSQGRQAATGREQHCGKRWSWWRRDKAPGLNFSAHWNGLVAPFCSFSFICLPLTPALCFIHSSRIQSAPKQSSKGENIV